MKRIRCLACLTALLLLTALPVCAADYQQVTLSANGGRETLLVTTENNRAAAWEIPTLDAGERLREAGTVTLTNLTENETRLALSYVELPFDNTDALTYLNHLNITVREGDAVLYDGAYSRINDEGGLAFAYTLSPGQSVTLTVDLRRDYAPLAVTGFESGAAIEWKFRSIRETVTDPAAPSQTTAKPTTATAADTADEPFDDPELAQAVLAVGAAAALLALVWVVQKARK